jgi:phosphatidylglycerol:prolipoprotein diacylglycerol transferase
MWSSTSTSIRIRSTCFALWQGGATFYGGFILAVAASYFWIQKNNLSFLKIADIMSPSIALGVGVHAHRLLPERLAVTASRRTCRGVSCFRPILPRRTAAMATAQQRGVDHVALHPTQIYSSFKGLVIFTALMLLQPRLKRSRAPCSAC